VYLAGEFAKEFALIHVVFEGLVAINKDHRDFVGESAPEFVITFHINFSPRKTTTPLQLGQGFLHDLAEVTPLARINDDLARLRHERSLAMGEALGN
jgi:hypothetical protein